MNEPCLRAPHRPSDTRAGHAYQRRRQS
jgi:hypothetical protein